MSVPTRGLGLLDLNSVFILSLQSERLYSFATRRTSRRIRQSSEGQLERFALNRTGTSASAYHYGTPYKAHDR